MDHRDHSTARGRSNFIRIHPVKRKSYRSASYEGLLRPDPEISVDVEKLHHLLDSLEGLSGE